MVRTPLYQTLKSVLLTPINRRIGEVSGVEHLPTGGYLLAPNHVDFLDGFYVAAAIANAQDRPVTFLTKTNYYWWTGQAVQIPIEKKREIIPLAVERLRRGDIICNFPEGQRNPGRKLAPGRTGTVRMAVAAGVPVVPVGITCAAGQSMAQSIHYFRAGRQPITLRFGPPMYFSAPPMGADDDFYREQTDRLMRAIAPLANKTF